MKLSASSWAIENPVAPILLFLLLTIAGYWGFCQLPINNMPVVVVPTVSVELELIGATPSEIEAQITRKVEGAVAELPGVKHINSTISQGISTTVIEFQLSIHADRAISETREAVNSIRDNLPRAMLEPRIQTIDPESKSIVTYSIEAPQFSIAELSWFVEENLTNKLLTIPGIAKLVRKGGVDHAIHFALQPAQLDFYGITAAEVSNQLAAINQDLPGGQINIQQHAYNIHILANRKTLAEIGELPIIVGNQKAVKLSQLGSIINSEGEANASMRLNGQSVMTVDIYKQPHANEVKLATAIDAALAQLQKQFPNYKIKKVFSLTQFTKDNFHSVLQSFWEGAILTVLVVFLFLRDRRATLIAVVTIPLSIIPTFLFMHLFGFSLNGVSLLAISLVTGVLVDDAIVEIENIHRYMQHGFKPYAATKQATSEIGLAVIATTLVICAVFLPVSFMQGVPAQYFKQFGITVAIAAFFSLLVARLITPILAAKYLRPPQKEMAFLISIKHYYRQLITWTLAQRGSALMIAVATLMLSFGLIPLLSTSFMPYEDQAHSKLFLELPQGTALKQTDQAAQQIAALFRQKSEVEYVLTQVDTAESANKAFLDIKLKPASQRVLSQREFEHEMLPLLLKIPDMRIGFLNSNDEKDIAINLLSDDPVILNKTAAALEIQMKTLPELQSVIAAQAHAYPEISIKPDLNKAALLEITAQQISDTVRIAMVGDSASNLTNFNDGLHVLPIYVRLIRNNNQDLETLGNLKIRNNSSSLVPLKTVAEINYTSAPIKIERYDRQRKITLEANLNDAALGTALDKIYALPALKNLPANVQIENDGDAESMNELYTSFAQAIIAGLLLVYTIQVLLYQNWLQPIIRMAALPLAIGGALIALLLTGYDISLPSIIGILMLMAIADKNSILLVDYILQLMRSGIPRDEAIIEASITRFQPIIMTSLAMLAAMLPLAFGIGGQTSFRAPMAIAACGGLISSTILSLIFVPVLFSYMQDFEAWLHQRFKGSEQG